MSRNALIAITIAAIIILGAIAAFLYSQTRPDTKEVEETTVAQEAEPKDEGMKLSTITDIFSRSENIMCTFDVDTEEGATSGTVYVSGDNARGEFTTNIDDETYTTNMIRNDDTFYMWGDSFPTGLKMVMSIDEWAESVGEQQEEETATFDPNTQVDFKCSAWSVDDSLFEAPTDIKFVTFQGMMGGTTTPQNVDDEVDNETQCNICNSLTGDAKTTCLEQLNCN